MVMNIRYATGGLPGKPGLIEIINIVIVAVESALAKVAAAD